MKIKIKVPKIWYDEYIKSYKEGIIQEPQHLHQLQVRREAMELKLPTEHDVKFKTTKAQLNGFIKNAKNNIGKSKIALAKFIEKYESSTTLKPDYAGAEKYLLKHKDKINGEESANGKWDVYAQMSFIEDKFYLPVESEQNFSKVHALLDKIGIETY